VIRIEDIKFDEDYYDFLIRFLVKTTGLKLGCYQRKHIEKRIKSRMIRVNCSKLDSYYRYVLENPTEIDKFLISFNINYSTFFRNWEVYEQLEDLILKSVNYTKADIISDLHPNPERKYSKKGKKKSNKIEDSNNKKKNLDHKLKNKLSAEKFLTQSLLYKKLKDFPRFKQTINIWSCPCANGEEPYSIAIIIDNLKKQIPQFPEFKIVASDIDENAIKRAKIGRYNEESTKNISRYFEKNYFLKEKEGFGYRYIINEEIKEYIEFFKEDVMKGHQTSLIYDVIFCRYLLIYINRETRKIFLKILENRLNVGGLLFLGKTETIFSYQSNLKLVDSLNRIYMKTN
jgi:chemotaxis methyl-accepting protein methylase